MGGLVEALGLHGHFRTDKRAQFSDSSCPLESLYGAFSTVTFMEFKVSAP